MKKRNIYTISVPDLPESVNDASIVVWHKKIGERVKKNEAIVDIETDKITLEITAVVDGFLEVILEKKGSIVKSNQVIGKINTENTSFFSKKNDNIEKKSKSMIDLEEKNKNKNFDQISLSPSNRRLLKIKKIEFKKNQKKIDLEETILKKNNINNHLKSKNTKDKKKRNKNVIPMSRIRKKISEKLLFSNNNTVMTTTINEVNMKHIIELRRKYEKKFLENYGIRLGYMPFYVKSVVESLIKYPEINSSIKEENIIQYNYYDVNIAVATKKGLVTPILKNADLMNMDEIEKKIKQFVLKGEEGSLTLDDLSNGTFTISNGGIFGSLISTPIINYPQSAILGINNIKDRPIVDNGTIKIFPMVYLSLSYDHRLIDGKLAICFLNSIKDILEDFSRIVLKI
ncbi:Dihydrolipoyllysine-residue succinyltransferase component of 2-oxoglutarate dehydrogenase complex [Buchnera aphidicola (Tetraneura ulmi)]|uniref:dihydrolipoyllysine-residue succinyltransferase n=1 Tax=Buchnera aphidicola TaxID=9 RepID=UPI0034643C88